MEGVVHEKLPLPASGLTARLSYAAQGCPAFGAVLFPPNPEFGGHARHPLLLAVAQAAAQAGGLALRVPYPRPRPEWMQQGGPVFKQEALPQLLCGWREAHRIFQELLKEKPLYGFGYSLGAHLLLLAGRETSFQRPVLAAPPLAREGQPARASFGGQGLLIMGDLDFACEESAAAELAQAGPGEFALRVIAGSDHFFRGDESLVARLTIEHWHPTHIETAHHENQDHTAARQPA